MRYVLACLVLGVGVSTASADPSEDYLKPWEHTDDSSTLLEVGGGWMRADPDGMTYRAEYIRFAPQLAFKRWFYVGAALQIGRIYGSSGTLNGMLPIPCTGNAKTCTGPGNNLVDETSGTIVEPQAFLGVRDLVGIVSGSFEVAPTLRWTTASVNFLNQSFTTSVTTIELHARLDVWATPHVSAGIMVGSDFDTTRNLEGGLQVGFHWEPYDAMKRW